MGVMAIIKKGFGIATKMIPLVVILFIFNAVWNIGSIPIIKPGTASPALTAAAVIFSLLFILASVFIQGSTLGLVRDHIKSGTSELKNFITYGLKYYLKLFGLGLLIILIAGVIALIAGALIAVTAPANKLVLTIIASTIAVIIGGLGLYAVLLLILAPYALVCDEIGVIASMKRSIEKVRKSLGKVFVLLLLLILISLGIGFLIGLITGLATIALPAAIGQVIIGIVNSAFNAYLGIVMLGSLMVMYLGIEGSARPQTAAAPKP